MTSVILDRMARRPQARSAAFRGWDRFDFVMVAAALALVVFGLALIYSATQNVYDGPAGSFANPVAKQAIFACAGLAAMIFVSRVDYHWWTHYAWFLYGAGIVALLAVLAVGTTTAGATRWFDAGPVQVQPSEFAKVATIIALARLFDSTVRDPRSYTTFLWSLAVVLPVAGLVFIEPDLGTAVTFGAIWLGVVLVAGVPRNMVIMFCAVGVAIMPFVVTFAFADYQVNRVAALVDPYEDAQGEGYNNIQSQIAIGSGQLLGKGLTNGEQTQLSFLKVPTSDFIFSVLGEELGFVGAMVLFALLMLLLFRGLRAAQIASDSQGQLIAAGIVTMILSQAFINIAVNLSLFPVTGIPLPFVSQGGSSLVTMFIAVGLLQSVIVRHRVYRQM